MAQRAFDHRNEYRGLQEAVEAILCEEDSDAEIELVTLPPDPSALTDEEEGDDDNIQGNNIPQDVPGRVEVLVDREEEQWSDSDDEPLSASKRPRSSIEEPRWRKCVPTYQPIPSADDNVSSRLQNLVDKVKNQNPVNIFEMFFDEEVMTMISQYSQMYAAQNNKHDFHVSIEELKIFFGILLLTGYHSLPRERLYWSLDEDCKVSIFAKSMSRNRFLEIKKYLHFCDNTAAAETSDKMFKVRSLADILIKKFLQWGVFHQDLSIDESMVKYFGRHPAKQFIRGKPVRFGYKNWMVTSSDGYCYGFDIYCGKSSAPISSEPLGTRVVKQLLEKLETTPTDHVVYFDIFLRVTLCYEIYANLDIGRLVLFAKEELRSVHWCL